MIIVLFLAHGSVGAEGVRRASAELLYACDMKDKNQ